MPIDGGRLAAALAARKWTARDLAERARVPDSTIHYITGGERERCQRSARDAIARVLGYDADWLGGEREDLPLPAGWRRPGLRFPTTPRAYLAAWELLAAVFKRLAREPRMADDDAARLIAKLLDLLDVRTWRANLLGWPPRRWRDVRPVEMEAAVPALAEALRITLAPWLREYDATPNLDALSGLLPHGARQPVLGASAVLPPPERAAREDTSLTAAERDPDRFLPPLGAPGHEWQEDKEGDVPRGPRRGAVTADRTLRVSGRAEDPVSALTPERLDEVAARLAARMHEPKAWILEQVSPDELARYNALESRIAARRKARTSRRRSAPRSPRGGARP